MPEPSLSTNRTDLLSTVSDRKIHLALTSIFGLDLARNSSEYATLSSAEVKTFNLSQPRAWFKQLMQNKEYASAAHALLADAHHRKGYFITAYMTTKGSEWKRQRKRGGEAGFDIEVPVSTITGLPLDIVNPGISPSVSGSRELGESMKVEGEEVFAVAYDSVRLKRRLRRKSDANGGFLVQETVMEGPVVPSTKTATYSAEISLDDDEDVVIPLPEEPEVVLPSTEEEVFEIDFEDVESAAAAQGETEPRFTLEGERISS